jgi:hypothetical protein
MLEKVDSPDSSQKSGSQVQPSKSQELDPRSRPQTVRKVGLDKKWTWTQDICVSRYWTHIRLNGPSLQAFPWMNTYALNSLKLLIRCLFAIEHNNLTQLIYLESANYDFHEFSHLNNLNYWASTCSKNSWLRSSLFNVIWIDKLICIEKINKIDRPLPNLTTMRR